MAAISIGVNDAGIPTSLQLLLLQYLASVRNETQTASSYNRNITKSQQSVTVTVDNDFFNNEALERLIISAENNFSKAIKELKADVEEVKQTSSKSEEMLNDVLRNFVNTSVRYQHMIEDSNKENVKQSNRNVELQNKLVNLAEEGINAQNSWTTENTKLLNANKELQIMLANMTNRNENLEVTVLSLSSNMTDLRNQILKLTESNQELRNSVDVKNKRIKQLDDKVEETTRNNQQLSEDLSKVNENYRKVQQSLGLADHQDNYCLVSPNSLLWKLSHIDPNKVTPAGAFVWTPTHSEVVEGRMQILYSSTRDIYVRGVGKEELTGWDKGIYEQNSMFRMVENDFKFAYLARKVGTSEGMISWKFNLHGSGTSVDEIKIRFPTSLFFGGVVDTRLCTSSECVSIPGDRVFETTHFQGVSQFVIIAKTSLGFKEAAWQHGQLFRQLLSDLTGYALDLNITLRKCDIIVL